MSKIIAALCTVFLLGNVAGAQPISIRDSGFVLLSNDTTAIITDRGPVNSLGQPGVNATWDLSLLAYRYPIGYRERQAPRPGNDYPTAAYMYKGGNAIGQVLQFVNNYYSVDSTGIVFLGYDNAVRQAYPYPTPTSSPADSIIFPPQSMRLIQVTAQLPFPVTAGASWAGPTAYLTRSYVYSKTGNLVNAPMMILTRQLTADTVVGWGRMRIRMPDSNRVSAYIPVLQIHENSIEIDSFFMNSRPAPDSVLNYLGLTQGQKTIFYKTKFLRSGEIEPILTLIHAGTYASAPVAATAVLMRLPPPQQAGVGPIVAGNLRIYPNPVRGRQVTVSSPGAGSTTCRYILLNFQGQNLATGNLHLNQSLHLPDSLPAGLYVLSVFDAAGHKEAVALVLE